MSNSTYNPTIVRRADRMLTILAITASGIALFLGASFNSGAEASVPANALPAVVVSTGTIATSAYLAEVIKSDAISGRFTLDSEHAGGSLGLTPESVTTGSGGSLG